MSSIQRFLSRVILSAAKDLCKLPARAESWLHRSFASLRMTGKIDDWARLITDKVNVWPSS